MCTRQELIQIKKIKLVTAFSVGIKVQTIVNMKYYSVWNDTHTILDWNISTHCHTLKQILTGVFLLFKFAVTGQSLLRHVMIEYGKVSIRLIQELIVLTGPCLQYLATRILMISSSFWVILYSSERKSVFLSSCYPFIMFF